MSVCRWCGRTACSEHSDLERRLATFWSGRVFHDAVRAPDLPTPPQAVRLPAAMYDEKHTGCGDG